MDIPHAKAKHDKNDKMDQTWRSLAEFKCYYLCTPCAQKEWLGGDFLLFESAEIEYTTYKDHHDQA